MSTKPPGSLGADVDMLATALLQSTSQTNPRKPARVVSMRPGETQQEAQRRVAAFRAKLR